MAKSILFYGEKKHRRNENISQINFGFKQVQQNKNFRIQKNMWYLLRLLLFSLNGMNFIRVIHFLDVVNKRSTLYSLFTIFKYLAVLFPVSLVH